MDGPVVLEGAKEKTETLKLALPLWREVWLGPVPWGSVQGPGPSGGVCPRGRWTARWGGVAGLALLDQEPAVSRLLHLVKLVL